jgi:hypothetical protein
MIDNLISFLLIWWFKQSVTKFITRLNHLLMPLPDSVEDFAFPAGGWCASSASPAGSHLTPLPAGAFVLHSNHQLDPVKIKYAFNHVFVFY